MALLLGEDFNQLFGSFERSARRLEARDRRSSWRGGGRLLKKSPPGARYPFRAWSG